MGGTPEYAGYEPSYEPGVRSAGLPAAAGGGNEGACCSSGASGALAIELPPGADGCPYRAGPRSRRDAWWFRALLGLGAAALLGGIIAAAKADQRCVRASGVLQRTARLAAVHSQLSAPPC